MAGEVYEWYGYRPTDKSEEAVRSAAERLCPFVPGPCTKVGGACSVRPQESQEIVPVCPKRMYFSGHLFLRRIAREAFSSLNLLEDAVDVGHDGQVVLPRLVPGDVAAAAARAAQMTHVGVFGQEFASEVRLPAAVEGGSRYSVDFTVVAVAASGDLLAFVPVEVQSIDTVGSYKSIIAALEDGRRIISSDFGMNWENVNKRILPQLILKGLILQGERLCTTGIYFVTPEAVFQRIMTRLGGSARLREVPQQPGSITFVRLKHDLGPTPDGETVRLVQLAPLTICTSDMSLAFITPQNLPASGSYELAIVAKMASRRRAIKRAPVPSPDPLF
jgi:hypothetical protein